MTNGAPTPPGFGIVPIDIESQAVALDRVYLQKGNVYSFAGDIVDTICDPENPAVWVPWFRCVAIEFLIASIGRHELADVLAQITTASAHASVRAIPAHGIAFPGSYPYPSIQGKVRCRL